MADKHDDDDFVLGGEPCRNCGESTDSKGPFGEALCVPCWEDEDDAIDAMST